MLVKTLSLHWPSKRFLSSLRRFNCGELRSSDAAGQEVTVSGWLQYQRLSGKFFTLRDGYGVTQVIVPDGQWELSKLIESVPLESVVQVTGTVSKRPEGLHNVKMPTGDIEINAKDIQILNKCHLSPQPFQISRAASVNELVRLQYRYIDLRSKEMQEAIRCRSRFLFQLRNFFIGQHNFVEVETPYLFRKTPAGAREFVVPTRVPGHYFCLPQSPQQFKQVLMAGAIDRYIQVARCFRDESARADRQPEFTQVDMEMAFADEETIRAMIEGAIVHAWPALNLSSSAAPPPSRPFRRMTYKEVMEKFGSDKPDLRFDWTIQQSSSKRYKFIAFDGTHRLFTGDGKKALQELEQSLAQKYPNATVYVCKWIKKMGRVKSIGSRYLPKEVTSEIESSVAASISSASVSSKTVDDGIIVVVPANLPTDANFDTNLWLGHVRHFVGSVCEKHGWPTSLDFKHTFEFLWVDEFPMFVPASQAESDTNQSKIGVECGHHPFTAPHRDDAELFYSCLSTKTIADVEKLLRVRSRQYDLVLNGREVGGGSVRIHDSDTQRRVLVDILGHKAEDFDFFLQALASGCPPHAGIALGIERLLAVLLSRSSVREVMAFPKSSEGRDVMTGAPCVLPKEDLDFYGQNNKLPKSTIQQPPKPHQSIAASQTH